MSYWNKTGKHQAWDTENFRKLVPAEGKCATHQGELLRASAKLYYDYYNNGMCNNTSGAVNFLLKFNNEINCKKELLVIKDECNTGGYTSVDLEEVLEIVANQVIEYVQNSTITSNELDMWDFQDADATDEDDCYEDNDE